MVQVAWSDDDEEIKAEDFLQALLRGVQGDPIVIGKVAECTGRTVDVRGGSSHKSTEEKFCNPRESRESITNGNKILAW